MFRKYLTAAAAAVAAITGGVFLYGTPTQAIVGGTPVTDGSYGFVAKLQIGEDRSCSGALIDPQWVITAKSCFPENGSAPGAPKLKTSATLGRTTLSSADGEVVEVVHLVPREDRDVVLARLARIVSSPQASLPGPLEMNMRLTLAGFGRTADEWVPDKLHTATVKATGIATNAITVASASETSVSACKGDAGAPLIREVVLRQFPGGARTYYQVAALATRSWQQGCFGSTELRNGVTATRTDDLGSWMNDVISRDSAWMVNFKSEMCLGTANSTAGAAVVQEPCSKAAIDQRWTAVLPRSTTPWPEQTPPPAYVQVKNGHGLCLDIEGGAVLKGKSIVQAVCVADRESQMWRYSKRLPHAINSKPLTNTGEATGCIGIAGGNLTAGAKAILWSCTSVRDQAWLYGWPSVVGTATTGTAVVGAPATQPSSTEAPDDTQGQLLEDFNYPGADAILAAHNIKLIKGDGHIVFADCAAPVRTGEGRIDVDSNNINGHPKRFCFRVTTKSGWLALEVPAVYAIDGRKAGANSKVTAELTTQDGEHTTVDVSSTHSTPVGVGADPENKPTTLLELRIVG